MCRSVLIMCSVAFKRLLSSSRRGSTDLASQHLQRIASSLSKCSVKLGHVIASSADVEQADDHDKVMAELAECQTLVDEAIPAVHQAQQ